MKTIYFLLALTIVISIPMTLAINISPVPQILENRPIQDIGVATPGDGVNGYLGEVIFLNNDDSEQNYNNPLNPLLLDCNQISQISSPALTSPSGTQNTVNPLYVWSVNGNMNANGMVFRFQVASDNQFSSIVYGFRDRPLSGQFRFPWNLDPAKTYYWRGWLECTYNSVKGPYSTIKRFTTASSGISLSAPSLIGPPDDKRVHQNQVKLKWSSVAGASEYLVNWRVSGSNSFRLEWIAGNEYSISSSELSEGTTYEWWITARNDYGLGTSSPIYRFTVVTPNYLPELDGYGFRNQSRPRPSWEVFQQTFSNSSFTGFSYVNNGIIYNTFYNDIFSGVCDGMASTSLDYYKQNVDRPSRFGMTSDLSPEMSWPLIEQYHGRQLSKGILVYRNERWNNFPGVDAIYEQLKSNLAASSGNPVILSFVPGRNNSIPCRQEFGHSVVPYRIEEAPGSWGKVYVYDPNHVNDPGRYFYFDFQSQPHTFTYEMGFPVPRNEGSNYSVRSTDGWIIYLTPLSEYRSQDSRVLNDSNTIIGWLIKHTSDLACDIKLINKDGQLIGSSGDVFTSEIPNSSLIFDGIAPDQDLKQLGFYLPATDYRAEFTSSDYDFVYSSITNTVQLELQSATTNFETNSYLEENIDYLQLNPDGSGLVYSTTSTLDRSLNITFSNNLGEDARLWKIANSTTSGPSEVELIGGPETLYLLNSGLTNSFDLEIRDPQGWFISRGITITADTAITIQAPVLNPTSLITMTVSLPGGPILDTYILENQSERLFIPIVLR